MVILTVTQFFLLRFEECIVDNVTSPDTDVQISTVFEKVRFSSPWHWQCRFWVLWDKDIYISSRDSVFYEERIVKSSNIAIRYTTLLLSVFQIPFQKSLRIFFYFTLTQKINCDLCYFTNYETNFLSAGSCNGRWPLFQSSNHQRFTASFNISDHYWTSKCTTGRNYGLSKHVQVFL